MDQVVGIGSVLMKSKFIMCAFSMAEGRLLGWVQNHESHSHGRQMQAIYYLPYSISN